MLALYTFAISGVASWWHYAFVGAKVGLGFTVWTAWFFAVLIASGIDCLRTKDKQLVAAWGIMALGWAISMMAWRTSLQPLVDLTTKNLIVMSALLIVSRRRETSIIAALHGLIIIAAFLAAHGIIPGPSQRPRDFLAWSYPDIAAGLQHASLIIISGWWMVNYFILGIRSRFRSMAFGKSMQRVIPPFKKES